MVDMVKRLGIAFAACLASFLVLLALAYCIPVEWMGPEVGASAAQLEQETSYYDMLPNDLSHRIDNYTNAIMVNMAAHGSNNPWESALLNPYYRDSDLGNDFQIASLREGIGLEEPDGGTWAHYSRYWNGWLVVLKPLLCVLDLSHIRMLLFMGLSALLVLSACLMARRQGAAAGLSLALPAFAVNYFVATASMSLSFSFIVAYAAVIFVLMREDRRPEALDYAVPFFVVGALTTYLDFLCTPIITLGLPLATLVFLRRCEIRRDNLATTLFHLAALSLCWFAGYVLLWASKWALATLLTGEDVVGNALHQVSHRVSSEADDTGSGTQIGLLSPIVRNMRMMFPLWSVKAALCCCGAIILAAFLRGRAVLRDLSLWWLLPLACIGLLPYIWYLVASNHSYVHVFFTYRAQVVTVLALLLPLSDVLTKGPHSAQRRSHPDGRSEHAGAHHAQED